MTYPNGRVITYNYATGLDNTISRLTSIADGSTTLESLSYLGLNTVVKRSHPQDGVDLTYIKQTGESNGDAGDQYTGLDRFGRVVDQRWIITSSGTATDRFQYGYDRDSNVLYRDNLVNSSFGKLYQANGDGNGYNNLNQLTNFARSTLKSTKDTISSPSHSISWSFDDLGNWTSVVTDGSTQTRTANQQNEITSISGQTTPGYDANGNTTTDQSGHTLIFDAWNRLVQVKNGSTVLEAYSYDAPNRRITENPGTLRDIYFSSDWQVIEEDVSGSMADQYVWSPVYVNGLIERDTPTQRLYVQQNANFDVTAVIDSSGNVQERYIYDPFGAITILAPDWSTRGTSSFAWIFLHQGGRFDLATGLYSFRNRDYSPALGRWLEINPAGFGGRDFNLYRDEGNRPTANLQSGPTGSTRVNDNQVGVDSQGNIIYGETGWVTYIEYDNKGGLGQPNTQFMYTGKCYILVDGKPKPVPCPSAGRNVPFLDTRYNCAGFAFGTYTDMSNGQEVYDRLEKKCTRVSASTACIGCERKCFFWQFKVQCRPTNAAGQPTGPWAPEKPDLTFHIVCQNSKTGSCCSKDGHRPLDPRDGPPMTFKPVPYMEKRDMECRYIEMRQFVFCCKNAADLKGK
jgi:RHS repeat-associated protein